MRGAPRATSVPYTTLVRSRVWHWAEARIHGETLLVSCPEVKNPVAVRYAYSMNPTGANLYNVDGLPASAFRTDDW